MAKELNLKYYFTGQACVRGHIVKRFIGGHCTACVNERSKEWSSKNKKRSRQIKLNWIRKNPDKDRKCHSIYKISNRERLLTYQQSWYEKNKERKAKYISKWRKDNKGKSNAISAKRRATKKQAIPKWANFEKLKISIKIVQ